MPPRLSARRAGASARARFRQERRRNLRQDWRAWAISIAVVIGAFVYSFYLEGVAARLPAAFGGVAEP